MDKAVGITVILFSALASNAPEPVTTERNRKAPAFADLDSDGNGGISRREAGNFDPLQRVFAAADTDGSGELLVGEYRRAARRYLRSSG